MRKLFLIFAILPMLSLADLTFTLPRGFYYSSTGSFSTNLRNGNQSPFTADQAVYALSQTSYKGIPVSFNKKTGWTTQLLYPDFSISSTNRSSTATYNYPFLGSDGQGYPYSYFNIYPLYSFIRSLYLYGYKSEYFELVLSNDVADYYNVKPLNLMLEIINGTNSVYKQEVINTLKLLNSNISSISSNFDTLISDFRSLNSFSLGDYSTLSNDVKQLALQGVISWSNESEILNNLTMSDWDLTDPEGLPSYQAYRAHVVSSLNATKNLKGLLEAIDPRYSPGSTRNIKDVTKQLGDSFNTSVNDALDGIQSSIDGSIDAIRTLNTNWVEEAKRELGTLNTSVSNQNTTIERVISHSNAVKVVGADGGAIQVTGAVTLDTHGQDLHVWLDGPVSLDVPTLDALTSDNDLIEQTLIDFKSLFEQWYKDDQDNSWLKFFEMARDWRINEIADNTSNQVEVAWEIHTAATNILASMTNDYKSLLLTDYDQFVSNGVYDSMVTLSRSFNDDCLKYGSATYSDMLNSLGLGSGEGRWWQYITAHLGLMGNISVTNYYMMSYVFSNLVETIQYANDQFEEEGGFLGQATKLIKSIPKEADVVSQIDNITNTINSAAVGFNEVYTDLGSTSNQFNQAISTYYVKKNLPDNIQLQILPGIEPFRIPVGDRRELFDLLRMGMAFAISIVNLILLPKFILKLFTLFFGVVDSQIKIASMDQTPV